MDRNDFYTLVLLTKDIGGLTDSKSMSSSEKLAMFLNILAYHEKNRSIKVDYIRSGWSVRLAFNECLSAILKLTPLLLVNPKPVLEDEIEDRWKWFEGCLGALDGTYIPIRVPIQHKPRYRTRKGEISTNVLGVCYRNLNFTSVLPRWEGSVADGHVLRDVIVRRNGLKIHEEELFNMRHARARNVIERAFDLLKGRWGILRSSSWYSVKVHNRIISACCLIHNFIRREMEVDPLDIDIEEQMEYQHENIDVIESSEEWTTWRDELAQSMAIGQFAEGPLDAIEEIQKSQAPQHSNDMGLGFPIDADLDDYDEEENAYNSSKVGTEEAENATGQGEFAKAEDFTEPSSFTGAKNVTGPSVFNEGENVAGSENEDAGSRKSHKQGEYSKRSSSNVKEKEKNKKRKKNSRG
ncbi:hypothetical protein KY289_030527 [Solanum tuberosum]|nr:hypothetical protein KY289_030527 [Solanum tuberosum]